MWILIWIVLSSILIFASAWSFQILQRQKKAWETFASSRSFTFKRGTLMGPAEMTGVMGEYKLAFFTAEREGLDVRTRRYVTALEIELEEGLVDGGVIGTKEMLPFMQSLDKLRPFPIEQEGWDATHQAFMKNHDAVRAYLSHERLEAISQLLKTRNADVLLVFNHERLLLRIETIDPMQDADKIDKIMKRLLSLLDRLRISKEERERYMALAKE